MAAVICPGEWELDDFDSGKEWPRLVERSVPPRKGRAGLAFAVLAAGAALVGLGFLRNGPHPRASRPSAAQVWVVQPGQTLWGIATAVEPAGADVRPLVDQLAAELHGAVLQPGQRLSIP